MGLGQDKIKLVFIGTGNVATQHMSALKRFNDVSISGAYDIAGKHSLAFKNGVFRTYFSSISKMFKKVEPDAAFICLPPFAHGEAEEMCIDANIPFFVEKPVSNKIDTAKRVMKKVAKGKLVTSVGYMNRYRKGLQLAREILNGNPPTLVKAWWEVGVPHNHSWLTQKSLSGGQILEQLTHMIDTIRYLCGDITSIYGYGAEGFVEKSDKYDIMDSVSLILKVKNGAIASIAGSWAADISDEIGIDISGPKVSIKFRKWEHDAEIKSLDPVIRRKLPGEKNIFGIEDRTFLDVVVGKRTKSEILCDYSEGVRTLIVASKANESIMKHKEMKWAPLFS